MPETDLEYYERRRVQELERQLAAVSPQAASVHRALALIYADEVRRLSPLAATAGFSAARRA